MKLKRLLLAADLSVIAPAIADKSKIPDLDCIWFDGKTASTYNLRIGIEKPLETDFIGGIPGKILRGYLDNVGTEEVSLTPKAIESPEDEELYDLHLAAGKSKLKLPIAPISGKFWKVPKHVEASSIVITKELLALLEFALVSVGKTLEQHTGVTIELVGNELFIYTTDAVTLSLIRIPRPKDYSLDLVTIPSEFCEQLIKICSPDSVLHLSNNGVSITNAAGTVLFGHILEVETPVNVHTVLKEYMPKHALINIPPELDSALDRVELLRQGRSGDPVEITIDGNNLSLYISNAIGELKDDIDIESDHPKVVAKFDPSLIKRALNERTFWAMNKHILIMTGPENFTHIISSLT